MDETLQAQPARALATLVEAEAWYRNGDYTRAEQALRGLVAENPAFASAVRLLGLCRLRQGDLSGALELLTRAHRLAPDDPWTGMHLGVGLQAAGRHAEAAALFEVCQTKLPADPAPCINLASARLAMGEARGALQAASDACFRAPQMAEAHYTYGLAWQAMNEPARAEASFTAAVRLRPAFADAWINLGLVKYRQGDVENAKVAMRAALQAAPGHRTATANLGAFMRLTGEADASERLLRDLLARDPSAVEARLNLAAELLSEERSGEALALLDGHEPRAAGVRQHWVLQRTLALLQLHRRDEARTQLDAIGETPAALRHLVLWRRVLLALAEGQAAQAHALAEEMELALEAAGESAVPEHRIMAYYDLAKFWSQANAPDRALANWRQGHIQLSRFQPFSRDAYRAFVDASIERLGRERLHGGARAGNADPTPVFIVGMPRSGTTLAEQILAAHSRVHGAGERNALGQAAATLGAGGESVDAVQRIAALDGPGLDQAARVYLAELHALSPDAERIVDKMPGNFRHLGLVGLMLPGARIIHCTRDPRDIGLSIFTFRFHGHHAYAHDLGDLGWYIGQHDRLMAHWKASLPNPILTVHLSDWVKDFQGTLTRVLAFLDLEYDPACERFYEAESRVRTVSRSQVRQPVNARGLGRWQAYADHLGPLLSELAEAGSLPPG